MNLRKLIGEERINQGKELATSAAQQVAKVAANVPSYGATAGLGAACFLAYGVDAARGCDCYSSYFTLLGAVAGALGTAHLYGWEKSYQSAASYTHSAIAKGYTMFGGTQAAACPANAVKNTDAAEVEAPRQKVS